MGFFKDKLTLDKFISSKGTVTHNCFQESKLIGTIQEDCCNNLLVVKVYKGDTHMTTANIPYKDSLRYKEESMEKAKDYIKRKTKEYKK